MGRGRESRSTGHLSDLSDVQNRSTSPSQKFHWQVGSESRPAEQARGKPPSRSLSDSLAEPASKSRDGLGPSTFPIEVLS